MNLISRCLFVLLLLLFPRFCSADPSLVKIGVLLTLSGSMSNWGQSARDGLILAQESINTSATHNEPRVELIFEDYGEFDLKRAASAAHKLITVDKVSFLLSYLTEDTEVVWNIAAQNKVPVIAMAAGAADITTGRPNVFRIILSSIVGMPNSLFVPSPSGISTLCTA